jgi:hypothetical protein
MASVSGTYRLDNHGAYRGLRSQPSQLFFVYEEWPQMYRGGQAGVGYAE